MAKDCRCRHHRLLILIFFLLVTIAADADQDGDRSEVSDSFEASQLEPIEGTQYFRVAKKGKENKSWYDGRETTPVYCVREAKCESLKGNRTCLGSKLPYADTSLILSYSRSQEQVADRLQSYMALRKIPKCWAVIQPFLCAAFLPRCEEIHGKSLVHLPSFDMCRVTLEPCRLVYNTSFFPEYLKCEASLFPEQCDNDVREMKFNTSSRCIPPLVRTEIQLHFYDGVAGCGLPCMDPLYSEDEQQQIRRFVFWGALVALFLNVFTALTFLVDRRSSSKYPALIIFYVNVCYAVSSLGWLSQFVLDSHGDIVCSKDGTRRIGEPSAGENLSCVTIFVLVYYFLMAACVWFVIFTYAWHTSFKALGKIQDRIDKKGAYFHLVAWSLPLVLTISTMALGEIDGSSVAGVCFVGYRSHSARAALLLAPLTLVLLVGGYFLTRGLLTLISVRTSSKDIISERASGKIRETIMRCAVTAAFVAIFIGATFVCHTYEFKNARNWYESFRTMLICRLTSEQRGSEPTDCTASSRPSVAVLQLQLLCLFCSAALMASWVWTPATVHTWKRFFRHQCGREAEEPVKIQKHKLIAQAFARRHQLNRQGRMSISFHNSHSDPVGLAFSLQSAASGDFCSAWANNLPRFVQRRPALTGAPSHSSAAPRRNSQDSQISFSLRHVSVESRRNSLDSQLSVKIAEMKTKVASRRRGRPHTRPSRRRPPRPLHGRKESSTSAESRAGDRILQALASGQPRHRTQREPVDLLLANGNMILPFLQNRGLTTASDDDDGSVASFKIRDSRLSIVLRQKGLNLSTGDDAGNSSANGLNITECQTDSEVSDKRPARIRNLDDFEPASSGEINFDNMSVRRELTKDPYGSSKSSSKSKSSRRSSRQSGRVKLKRLKPAKSYVKNREEGIKMTTFSKKKTCNVSANINASPVSSFDSYCSELGPLAVQSSFSGVSAGKNNSRNSKTSCDVGIQANSHEIVTQTLSSYENELNLKNNTLKKSYTTSDKALCPEKKEKGHKGKTKEAKMKFQGVTENCKYYSPEQSKNASISRVGRRDVASEPLLLNSKRSQDQSVVVKKRNDQECNISESRKLKELLLP